MVRELVTIEEAKTEAMAFHVPEGQIVAEELDGKAVVVVSGPISLEAMRALSGSPNWRERFQMVMSSSPVGEKVGALPSVFVCEVLPETGSPAR